MLKLFGLFFTVGNDPFSYLPFQHNWMTKRPASIMINRIVFHQYIANPQTIIKTS